VFDTLLMDRGNEQRYRDRSNNQWRAWLERVFRENRPWKDAVSEILLARPESNSDRGVVWFLYERKDDHQKIAESVARAFFGIRIDCAQCHDHMIASEIEQRHYWGLVAFFNRSQNVKTKNGPRVEESAIGGFSDFANLEGSSSPNLLTFFQSPTVDEQRPADGEKQVDADDLYMPPPREHEPRIPRFSRRQQLVDHIVADHPLLAPAFVNRVWAMLMGRGIVHPFDQMDSAHPPSHPELLADLASAFEDSGEDIRELVKAIVLSRPYQLTSVRPDGINDPSTFAWTLEKPLTAEQLSRSIQVAVQGSFRNDHPLTVKLRDALPDVMPEQSVTSIGDALFLTNNAAINDLIASSREPTHLVPTLLNITDVDQRADDLFTTVFGRLPTADERVRVAEFCQQDAEHRLPQVLWALLCSAEFRFNH
ncbi:MAG: DUF1553 domain-containing protein, partial [Planctomycetaceae bacterium]|nr:DUF1553 domain-containing protein [Planctomycetaceae bacterium]